MSNISKPADEPLDILVVEDNPGDVRLIEEAFSSSTREIRFNVCTNGDEAIDRLSDRDSLDPVPDMMLLDLNLPGRDGYDVLEEVRNDPELKFLPVIILTSSEAEEDVARSYEENANAYLTKPSDPTRFTALASTIEEFWFERAHLPPIPA